MQMKIALAGNPNCGKTTLFNALTGSNQYVGNWPGVTVDRKEGQLKSDKEKTIVDLPGIYSLSPYSPEEVIARRYLAEDRPDVIINIIDGMNLERNLYLTTQLTELGIPMIIAINMADLMKKEGVTADVKQIEKDTGCKVVSISAFKGEGLDQLGKLLDGVSSMKAPQPIVDRFGEDVEKVLSEIEDSYLKATPGALKRWYAIKLFERDEKIADDLKLSADQVAKIDKLVSACEEAIDDDAESYITSARYERVEELIAETVSRPNQGKLSTSDKIDNVVTNRWLGLPIFALVMFLVYYISVSTVGAWGTDWVNDGLFGDGWFLSGGSKVVDGEEVAYEDAAGEFDFASSAIEAFDASAEEAGIEPPEAIEDEEAATAEELDAYDADMQKFITAASDAGVTAQFDDYDDESGENSVVTVYATEDAPAVVAYEQAQGEIEAYTAAAEEAGIDPEAEDFDSLAEAAGITATYTPDEGDPVTVDSALYAEASEVEPATSYAAALEVEEPDPHDYGTYVRGIPAVVDGWLTSINCAPWLQDLLVNGIIAGVGAVLGFVPQLLVLFILLAILEGCGYMSRIAFVLDRVFRRFGLSGKSFVPILVGTGCGVPGIMASRTIENDKDRRMTVMTTTFIPCGAKLPIIALFAGAIFGGAWWVAPSAYFLGIAAILCSGIILKKTRMFAGETTPFVMELPAYHLPKVSAVLRSMWERAWAFIKKAGTIILVATILVWFLSSYGFADGGFGAVEDQADSLLAAFGNALAWIFYPLGCNTWQATAATITGLIAKENVVGTFGVLYAGGAGWYSNVQAAYLPAAGYALLAFNLLCAPCFAAMGAIRREMNSAKWFWAAIGYQCGLAYGVGLVIYQFAGLATGEVGFNFFTIVAIALVALFIFLLVRPQKDWSAKQKAAAAAAA